MRMLRGMQGLIHLVSKVFLDLLHHLQRQVIADGEHGEHHTLDVQTRVLLITDCGKPETQFSKAKRAPLTKLTAPRKSGTRSDSKHSE